MLNTQVVFVHEHYSAAEYYPEKYQGNDDRKEHFKHGHFRKTEFEKDHGQYQA